MNKTTREIMNVLKGYATLKEDLSNIPMISSPTFDGVNSPSQINHNEDKLVNHANLSYQVHKIEEAIDALNSKDRFIILKYIIAKEYTQKEMCQRYHVSKTGFNYQKNQALNSFAENYGLDCHSDQTKKQLMYS